MLLPDCMSMFEDLERKRNGLFLVTCDPLHVDGYRQARLQRQQQKQEEWRAAHSDLVLDSIELDMNQDVHEDSSHELTPVPYDCELMDTEGGYLLWYEQHIVVDRAKAGEVFDCTIQQLLSPQWHNERAKRITASMAKEIISRKQLILLASSHA